MAEGRFLLALNIPLDWNEVRCRAIEDSYRRYVEIRDGKRIFLAQVVNIFSDAMLRTGQLQFDEKKVTKLGLGDYIIYTNKSDYISELDRMIYELYNKNRVYVDQKPVYWCDYCNTALNSREVKKTTAERDYLYGKIRLDEEHFFVIRETPEKFEDAYGLILNSKENYITYNLRGKSIICSAREWDEIKHRLEIGESEIFSKITYGQVLAVAKEAYVFVSDNLSTQLLTPYLNRRHFDLVKKFNIPLKKIDVDTFPAGKRIGRKYLCRYCDNEVKVKRVPQVYLSAKGLPKPDWLKERHYEDVMISGNLDSLPKIPILFCEKCGRWEFGHKEKPCECNYKMRKMFSYNEDILRFFSLREGWEKLYVTYPETIWYIYPSYVCMRSLDQEWFKEVRTIPKIKFEEMDKLIELYPPEVIRLALVSTKGRVTHSSVKKAWRFFNSIINVYRYYRLYQKEREVIENTDRWIISTLEKTKKKYMELLAKEKFIEAFNLLYKFVVEDLSGFYVKVIRGDKGSLEFVLPDLMKMSYVFIPETSRKLLDELHVVSEKLEVKESSIYEGLDIEIGALREIIKKINKLRIEKNIPFRKPLTRVVIVAPEDKIERIRAYRDVIMKLCNVMDVEVVLEWGEIHFDIIPNMEAFSDAYKPWVSKIAILLKSRDVVKVRKEIEKGGYVVGIEGQAIRITPNMVKFVPRTPEGYISIASSWGDVYVDIRTNDLVEKEYLVREVIRRIQMMKKDIEVEYDDLIDVFIDSPPEYRAILEEMADNISKRVRARKIDFVRDIDVGYVVEWGIIDKSITIGIVPLYRRRVLKAFTKLPEVTPDVASRLFDSGVCNIKELMNSDPEELGAIEGLSRAITRKAIDYLNRNAPFEKIYRDNKFYCPLCESELTEESEEECSYCRAPLKSLKTEEAKEILETEREEAIEEKDIEKLPIEFGRGYAFLDKFDMAYKIIANYARSGEKVLCITQSKPSEVIQKYKLPKTTRVAWISNTGEKGAVKPRDLEKLSIVIDGFLAEGGKIIMIDGVEFLISQNDFFAVLRFLQIVRDDIMVEKGLLIFPISSKNFPEAKLNILKKEFIVV